MRRPALLALVALAAPALRADGKFYFREGVPAKEPYQRAILAWTGTQELLIVQPKLLGEASEFAWVLPVPAEPRVSVEEAEDASGRFYWADRASLPGVVRVRDVAALVAFGASVVLLLRAVRRSRPTSKRAGASSRLRA